MDSYTNSYNLRFRWFCIPAAAYLDSMRISVLMYRLGRFRGGGSTAEDRRVMVIENVDEILKFEGAHMELPTPTVPFAGIYIYFEANFNYSITAISNMLTSHHHI